MDIEIYDPRLFENIGLRRQISLHSKERAGLKIMWEDPQNVGATVFSYTLVGEELHVNTTVLIPQDEIEHEGDGVYSFEIPPLFTSEKMSFSVVWDYETTSGQSVEFKEDFEVLHYMPIWDSFSDEEKGLVDKVMWRIADLYDNTTGGVPYFAEEFQSRFSAETIAKLMIISLDKINSGKAPVTNFILGPSRGKKFPMQWSGLLVTATYIEMIKHFMRSYVEQPTLQGVGVAQADRRDYLQRWQTILNMETDEYNSMLVQFKRKQRNFGSGALIVSGGIFGHGSSRPGMYASAARAGRFYPVSHVVAVR